MSPWSRAHRALAALVVVAAGALFASGFLWGATPDEEEFRFTVLTSWLHVRALAEGRYAFWTSLLGLGLPQPLIANYWFHPLLPLLAVMSPVSWMRLVLLVHTALGAAGMWRLCRAIGIRPIVAAVCAATFLLATPGQNYVLIDFWPSPWIAHTTMPWVLLCAWRVLGPRSGPRSGPGPAPVPPRSGPGPGPVQARSRVGWAAALGLLVGFIGATNNPGTVLVYTGVAAGLLLVRWRDAAAHWRQLLVAGAIAAAMVAPNAAALAAERRQFDPSLASSGGSQSLPPSTAWDVFLRPLSASDAPWRDDVVARGARTLFFGGPFAVLCVIACVRRGWHRPELVAGLALSALPMFVAVVPALGASDRYLFRDAVILCAVPLAGLAADRGLARRATKPAVLGLLGVQVTVMGLAVLPFLPRAWAEGRDGAPTHRGAVADREVADAIAASLSTPGRLLYSPRVDHDVRERALLGAGLGVNALAYRGVAVVNGWFKGVSADPIWPDERSFYARIRTPQALVESSGTLDVLGIRYVLATDGERVAADLRERRRFATPRAALVLYENEDAWPGAFLIDPAVARAGVPRFEACENDRLLCHDLSAIAEHAWPVRAVERRAGTIDVTFQRVEAAAVLVVVEMFRPEWQADSPGARVHASLAGALIGVDVPPGTAAVHLAHRPWPLIGATAAAWLGVIAGVLLMGLWFLRRGGSDARKDVKVRRATPAPAPGAKSVLVDKIARLRTLAQEREDAVRRWKELAGKHHRRILSRYIVRDSFPRRFATLAARTSIPAPADREAALREVSPAYVEAVEKGPKIFGEQVHPMKVDGLNWYMPIVRPTPAGPTQEWLRKQRFPYLALTQTRELAIGGIMLDLGANIGRMSIPRVVLGDVVAAYCAEPDPLNYACLVGNIVDNGLGGLLMPDHVAIGDREGTVTLSRGKYSGGHRVLAGAATEESKFGMVEVPCITVDCWLRRLKVNPDAVTFVKVDVQGFEMRVLQGASDLLSRKNAVWQLEMEPALLKAAGSSLQELCEKLKQHFTWFIDMNGEASGPRARPIAEINEALAYVGSNDDNKTDVLVY